MQEKEREFKSEVLRSIRSRWHWSMFYVVNPLRQESVEAREQRIDHALIWEKIHAELSERWGIPSELKLPKKL